MYIVSSTVRITFLACIFILVAGSTCLSQKDSLYTIQPKNFTELQDFFSFTGNNKHIISGHRGGTIKGYPENCIATFENTLRYTPAFFEIDPRLTKDSLVVLMHDATLNRTTNGTGKVSDYTLAELQRFRLKDPEGNVTDFKIPTLQEVISWSQGKTILNLDHKDVPLEMTARILKAAGNDIIMLTIHSPEQAKYYLKDHPGRLFSAHILTKQAFDAYDKAAIPWKNMIAYIGPKYTDENKELMRLLHAKGVLCMISAAPSYDKLPQATERAANYLDTFKQGADILESDLPIEVAEAIRPMTPNKYYHRKRVALVKK